MKKKKKKKPHTQKKTHHTVRTFPKSNRLVKLVLWTQPFSGKYAVMQVGSPIFARINVHVQRYLHEAFDEKNLIFQLLSSDCEIT